MVVRHGTHPLRLIYVTGFMVKLWGNLTKLSCRQYSQGFQGIRKLSGSCLLCLFLWSAILSCLLLSVLHLHFPLAYQLSLQGCYLRTAIILACTWLWVICHLHRLPTSDFQQSLCLSSNYLGNLFVSGQPVEWLVLSWSYSLFLVPSSVVRGKSHLARSYWLEWSLWERMWDGQENGLLKKKQNHSLVIFLSGPLQIGMMWIPKAINSQFSKITVPQGVWCPAWP